MRGSKSLKDIWNGKARVSKCRRGLLEVLGWGLALTLKAAKEGEEEVI
jgi:hypothetical protein